MDIKFKVVSLSAATVLTLAVAANSFAAVKPFTDLTNVPAKEKILALQERGYVEGVGDYLFAPNDTITAAQGIQLIVNALDLNLDLIRFFKEPKATDYLKKANDDAWYANALIIASVKGLELQADLDPNQEWTREEFTYHLIQAIEEHAHLPKMKLVPVEIADQNQLTIDYSGAIQRALTYGVAKLNAEGNFNPKGNISRAESAEQVYNALEYINAHIAPPMNPIEVEEKIGVRGTVKDIVNGKDGITFFVDGKIENDTQYDKATVTVNRNTIVLKDGINTLVALNYTEIKEGDIVEVKFKGDVSKSNPVLAVADTIIIMKAKVSIDFSNPTSDNYLNLIGVNKEEITNTLGENPVAIDEGGLMFEKAGIRVWFKDYGKGQVVDQIFTQRSDINFNKAKIGDNISKFRESFGEPVSDKNSDAHFIYNGMFLSVQYDQETGKTFAAYILKNDF